jgi:zinc transporter ZupT
MIFTFISALSLAAVHLIGTKLKKRTEEKKSILLSAAGGIAVAYVFVQLLPELAEGQQQLDQSNMLNYINHHIYLITLLGLIIFYGIERKVKITKEKRSKKHREYNMVFWLHIITFALYNILIGYLLHNQYEKGTLIFFSIAMLFHFFITDYSISTHHEEIYNHKGRWVLALAVIAGWTLGILTEVDKFTLSIMLAILAGGIILNVLKEELPEEKESNYVAFLSSALIYSLIVAL